MRTGDNWEQITGPDRVIDFEVQRSTRRCAVTDKPFEPGEAYVSLLRTTGNGRDKRVERLDYSLDHWQAPSESSDRQPADSIVGWWRSRMPDKGESGAKLAPNEVLLGLLDAWADEQERSEARYVLALLLVRRKVLRMVEASLDLDTTPASQHAAEVLRVVCPSRDEIYELPVESPSEDRIVEIQAELNELLYADSK